MKKKIILYRVTDDGWNRNRPLLWEVEATETPMLFKVPCCHATGYASRIDRAAAEGRGFHRDPEKAVSDAVERARANVEMTRKELAEAEKRLRAIETLAASDFRAQIVKAE